jgi:Family of unknown function (DUF5681)
MGNRKRRRPRRNQGHSEAGFGRPPQHSKWKPGQSGNPKGRPKGTRNFKTDVQAMLQAPVQVTRDGKPQKISTQEAVLFRLREKALNGEVRAIDQLVQLARINGNDELAASGSLAVEDEKVLRIYRERLLSGAAGAHSNPEKNTGSPDTSGGSVGAVQETANLKVPTQIE